MAARHTAESAIACEGVGQEVGHHGQPVVHDAVSEMVPVRPAKAAVQAAMRISCPHKHPVIVIQTHPGAEQFDQIGEDVWVIYKMFNGGSPGQQRRFTSLYFSTVWIGSERAVRNVI